MESAEPQPGVRLVDQRQRLPMDSPPPDFDRACRALEDALEAMPLAAADAVEPQLRREYAAIVLYVLQTRERLDLLRRSWPSEDALSA